MFWNRKNDISTIYESDLYGKPSYEELEKRLGLMEQKAERLEKEKKGAEIKKQLQEMRDFVSPGDTFYHCGMKYVVIGVGMQGETAGFHITWTYPRPGIKAQRWDERSTHEPVYFYYDELECLEAQNLD